jgi:hypothetical protein
MTTPNTPFNTLASNAQIERTMASMTANNFHVIVVETGAEARQKLLEMLPVDAEVFISSSTTLNTLGITDEIDRSGRYNSVRAKLAMMNPKTENREMQKMGASPEYMLGSVHALTETGSAIIASMTGSQLSGYAAGAANVVWVVGTQKIVATLEDGLKRVTEYVLPLEDARAFKAYGMHSSVNKLLVVHKEFMPGRTTVILVKESLGF